MASRLATIAEVNADPGGVAPQLSAVADADVTTYLDLGSTYVSTARFGERTSQAHALVTAHLLVIGKVTGVPASLTSGDGVVASKSHGPASVSYAIPAMGEGDAFWGRTRWGQLFLGERDRVRGRGSMVRTGSGQTY